MANILDRFQWFKLQSGTTNLEIEACLFVFKSGMRGQRGRTLLQNRGGWRRLAKITRCAGRKTTDIPCALMLILRISRVKYSHTPARSPGIYAAPARSERTGFFKWAIINSTGPRCTHCKHGGNTPYHSSVSDLPNAVCQRKTRPSGNFSRQAPNHGIIFERPRLCYKVIIHILFFTNRRSNPLLGICAFKPSAASVARGCKANHAHRLPTVHILPPGA